MPAHETPLLARNCNTANGGNFANGHAISTALFPLEWIDADSCSKSEKLLALNLLLSVLQRALQLQGPPAR